MKSPRTPKTAAAYKKFKEEKIAENGTTNHLDLADEKIIKEYTHWLIIENRFPYDAMTSVNHMLVPKRAFGEYKDTTEEERAEYHKIIEELAAGNYYDALVENFPRSRSLTRHAHIHLVRWKYTTDSGKNIGDEEPHEGSE